MFISVMNRELLITQLTLCTISFDLDCRITVEIGPIKKPDILIFNKSGSDIRVPYRLKQPSDR